MDTPLKTTQMNMSVTCDEDTHKANPKCSSTSDFPCRYLITPDSDDPKDQFLSSPSQLGIALLNSAFSEAIMDAPIFNRDIISLRSFASYLNDNDDISHNFVNRNPRSMELLRIARKPLGYCLDYPTRTFWYKLYFEKSQKRITAWVEHHSGENVVSASTNEWAIAKHLFSVKDASAAQNIGRVIAERCLHAGIYEVYTELKDLEDSSQKVKLFLDAVREGGISLEEAPQIREKDVNANVRQMPSFAWDVTEEDLNKLNKS